MHRRSLLSAVAGGVASLAGCTGLPGGSTPTPTPTVEPTPLAERGYPSDICLQDVVDIGIYAIDDPAFGSDWTGVEVGDDYSETGTIPDDHVVVGLAGDDRARAYPLSVLWWHEIVNDSFGPAGGPVMVTYCSLCRSGMVARRLVDGEPTEFGVSGQLWRAPELYARAAEDSNRTFAVERDDATPGGVRNTGNLVMFDVATGSYWSQLLARGICGPEEGTELSVLPAETATWADWRAAHPETEVLLPPPHSSLMELPL